MRRVLPPNHTKAPKQLCRFPSGYGVVNIGVSGSPENGQCGLDAYEKAKEVGREIARFGAIITTGAITGFSHYAAMGAKDECGFSIGFSPASSESEHKELYKLPTDYMDVIVYTGFGVAGRDIMLARSSDAIIVGCGRIGTINEFAVAFEDRKPIGILEGTWETDPLLRAMIEQSHRSLEHVIFGTDPKALVERLIEMAGKNKEQSNLALS